MENGATIKTLKSKGRGPVPPQSPRIEASDESPATERQTIRVLLVDDHPIVRLGLRVSLTAYGQIEIAGEADNGWDALTLAKKLLPDIVLMDVEMPRMDGLAATAMLRQQLPATKVLNSRRCSRVSRSRWRGFREWPAWRSARTRPLGATTGAPASGWMDIQNRARRTTTPRPGTE